MNIGDRIDIQLFGAVFAKITEAVNGQQTIEGKEKECCNEIECLIKAELLKVQGRETECLSYIQGKLYSKSGLNIYGKGNYILDTTREDNIFFRIGNLISLYKTTAPIHQQRTVSNQSMSGIFIRSIKNGKLTTEDIVRYCQENFVSEDEIEYLMFDLLKEANNAPEAIGRRLYKACNTIGNRWRIELFGDPMSELNPSAIVTDIKKRLEVAEADEREQQGQAPQKPQNKQRGRKTKTFADYLLGDEAQKAATLKALHILLQGKSGKDVVLILRAAVEAGKITKPTYAPVKDEFGNVGSESGYNKYMNNERAFSNGEIQGAITALKNQLLC